MNNSALQHTAPAPSDSVPSQADEIQRQDLEQSKFFLAAIVESSQDSIVTVDFHGIITTWNHAAEKLYGYSASEAIGQSLGGLTLPQDLVEVLENIEKVKHHQKVEIFDSVRVNKDGRDMTLEVVMSPVENAGNEVIGVSTMARDVTHRKQIESALRQSEDHLRFVIDASNDGIWEWDVASGKVTWSERIYTLLGLSSQGFEPSYQSQHALIHPDDQLGFERAISAHLETGQPYQLRVRYRHSDGTYLHVLARGATQHDGQGKALRMVGSFSDLTGLIKVEQEREAQSREIVTIWESMTDAFFSLDKQWRFTRINSYGTKLLHKSAHELIGGVLWDVFPDAIGSDFERQYRRAVQQQVKVDFEAFYPGFNAWFEVHAYPSPSGLSVYFHDITERKLAENKLRASEERFRAFMENTPARVFMKDCDGRYIYLNKAVEHFQGVPASELLGKTVYDRFPLEIAEPLHRDDLRVFTTGQAQQFEETTISAKGEIHHEIVAKFLLPDAAGEQFLAGVAVDVTEQKQAEAERDRFFTISQDMLAISGNDGYFKRLNPAFEATLGFSNAELMAMPFLEFVHPDDVAQTLKEMARLDNRVRIIPFENRFRCRDGSYKWLRWMSTPFEDLWYCVAHDVTGVKETQAILVKANDELEGHVMERTAELEAANESLRVENIERQMTMETLRQVADALQVAKEEAEAANAAKSEFLSRMSHELRTPLNAILGFGQLLKVTLKEERDQQAVGQILDAGKHLLGDINQLLDITCIEGGRLSISLEPVDVATLVQETLEEVRPQAFQVHLHAPGEAESGCVCYVLADEMRLKQVLTNLLSNAIKYNRPGGNVYLTCRVVAEEKVRIEVRDDGPGIAAVDLEKLFVPFERLGAATSGIDGTGLGLALCRGMVEAMGGRIGLESVLGQGMTAWVELPLASAYQAELELSPQATVADSIGIPTRTILMIEDNLSNQRLIECFFQDQPHIKLLPAMQGSRGLELAQHHKPDLILLDLHLPDITGQEVLRQLKTAPQTAKIPVVVVSADATATQIDRLQKEGATAYLTKPLDLAEFGQTILALL